MAGPQQLQTAARIALVLWVMLLTAAPPLPRTSAAGKPIQATLALTNATVIDGQGGPARTGMTILISDGRIVRIGPTGVLPSPPVSRVMDLRGLYVLPGFIDMHYHVTTSAMRYRRDSAGTLDSTYDRSVAERLLRVALARGITTIRDPAASPSDLAVALRNDLRAGRILGPRKSTAGELLSRPTMTESEIRAAIRAQAARGVDYIKVYAGFLPRQVAVAVDEAHRHGLKIIGHLQRTSWTEGANAGIDFITHAGNWHEAYVLPEHRNAYDSLPADMRTRSWWLEWLDVNGSAVDSMVLALAKHRVSVDPTLVAYHTKFWWRDSIYQHDPDTALVPEVLSNWHVLGMHTAYWAKEDFDRTQRGWPNLLALVRRLHAAGVLLTVGSDVASPWVIPGTGFHQELELLVGAGFSPSQVLTMATKNGALAVGIADSVGTIEVGKIADLVVLTRNPLDDVRNSRSIKWVIQSGVPLEPNALLTR